MIHYSAPGSGPEPATEPARHPTRRAVFSGIAALAGVPLLSASLARAADYPPTDGAMQGFILAKRRRPVAVEPFLDGRGNVRHFSDFRGQVLLVNFWATWCAPCIREMPDLAALHTRLGGTDFSVLAISQDRGGAKIAQPFVRERLELPDLPVFYDPSSSLGRVMGVRGLPTTFLIDRRGRGVGYFTGVANWDSKEAHALVRHVMREKDGMREEDEMREEDGRAPQSPLDKA